MTPARSQEQSSRRAVPATVFLAVILAGAVALVASSRVRAVRPPALSLGRDVLAFDSDRTGNFEIFTMRVDGSRQTQITSDVRYDSWWPKISPDRTKVLFVRTPKGIHDRDYSQVSIWVEDANGSNLVQLRPAGADGWGFQGHPEWSPDGREIALIGGTLPETRIFVTDGEGKNPRQVTSMTQLDLDPSWGPDGQTLLYIACPPSVACVAGGNEVFKTPASGGAPTRLTFDSLADNDPYFSPDGTQIAWLTRFDPSAFGGAGSWGIRIMKADGSTQRTIINDGQINSKPAWSLDGTRIFFHRLTVAKPRFSIFSILPDGTGLTELTPTEPGNNEFPEN